MSRAELAKEEQERLEREEEMKYSNMNKWTAMRMRVLKCSESEIKKQQDQVKMVSAVYYYDLVVCQLIATYICTCFKHDKKLSKRQSKLRDRIQSQMKDRQKVKRASTAPPRPSPSSADRCAVHVALVEVMQKDTLHSKREFDKETLVAISGSNDGIDELIQQYDSDCWKQYKDNDGPVNQEGGESSVGEAQGKEEIIALKMAQQRLKVEMEYEKYQSEQLKQSGLKQVLLSDKFYQYVTIM